MSWRVLDDMDAPDSGEALEVFYGGIAPADASQTLQWPAGGPALARLSRQAGAVNETAPVRRLNLVGKRIFDIGGAVFGLVLLAPVFVALALAVRLDSPGPVFFVQERWGRGRSRIRVLKFRTMHQEQCDHSGVAQTTAGDERVTRVGAFLRRKNLDELPQLINVLKGEMSLVGPRCHPVGMQAAGMAYEELVPHYHMRHAMRPGITGLAQVNGLRGPTDQPGPAVARIAHDLRYIATFNLLLDMTILVKTIIREAKGGTGL